MANGEMSLVCGAGGFIGGYLVTSLKRKGYWVRGADLKYPEFSETAADDFVIGDLRDPRFCESILDRLFARPINWRQTWEERDIYLPVSTTPT
jgi:nucleoside-diphosphate-sugar epimerase